MLWAKEHNNPVRASACLLAAESDTVGGKAYFITNDEPVDLWPFVNAFLAGMDMDPVTRTVPLGVARPLASAMEWTWKTFRLEGEPRLTHQTLEAFAHSHWFDITAAKQEIGYSVRVPLQDGLKRTVAWFREQETGGPTL